MPTKVGINTTRQTWGYRGPPRCTSAIFLKTFNISATSPRSFNVSSLCPCPPYQKSWIRHWDTSSIVTIFKKYQIYWSTSIKLKYPITEFKKLMVLQSCKSLIFYDSSLFNDNSKTATKSLHLQYLLLMAQKSVRYGRTFFWTFLLGSVTNGFGSNSSSICFWKKKFNQ